MMNRSVYDPKARTLTTERLTLRPFDMSDAQRIYEMCNNYNIYKTTLYLPYPYPMEAATSWIPTHEENFR
ncbi:MAG: GNAT family N-acetyltransferase [Defluviitaleaceae bacterium]|nr:GNAT family N-acetyltransferase [Defluviitaleaceae bacterium]